MRAARPGATIELTDSAEYSGPVTLSKNRDGVPLHGLTLRARANQSPLLVGDDDSPALRLEGVNRVTVDGIRFVGGTASVYGLLSSGLLKNLLLEDSEAGLIFEDSQFSLDRVEVKRTQSTALWASTSRLNITDVSIDQSAGEGMVLMWSPALIQRTTIAKGAYESLVAFEAPSFALFDSALKNNAMSLTLYDSPGLIKGNSISETSGKSPQDGIAATGLASKILIQDNLITSNARNGFLGSVVGGVRFFRNIVKSNSSSGFYLDRSPGAIESSLLISNGQGVRSEFSDLSVSNTLVAGSSRSTDGDGVYSNGGSLTLLNSTIANNRRGLRIAAGDHLVANSILYGNTSDDISGAQQTSFISNLTGSSDFAGLNGNLQGNPLFVNSAALNFSLQAGSPAIDGARFGYDVGLLDGYSHERTVDGNGDGTAQTDLGAFEYGADSGNPVILPVLSTKAGEFVGYALVNASAETCAVRLRGFDGSGAQFGSVVQKEIAAGAQLSLLLTETFQPLKEGWIEIRSDKPDLVSFSLLGDDSLTRMDGAQLAAAISADLLLPDVRATATENTEIFIVNPNPEKVDMTVTWISDSGASVRDLSLPAHGSSVLSTAQFFGRQGSGYVTVRAKDSADKGIFAMELLRNRDSFAGLLSLDIYQASSELLGAQLAVGKDLETILSVVNLGATADITFQAFNEAGRLLKTATITQLSPNSIFTAPASEIFGFEQEVVGWVRISAGTGAKLLGSVSFSDNGGGYLAALPLQSHGARESVFGHVAQTPQVFSGIALLNPTDEYAQISLEVFDRAGNRRGIALFELSPNEKRAQLLSEYIPDVGQQEGGFVRVRSNVAVFGFELFGNADLSFMSAVPQQVVVS
ncbi:MAG: right-handed parallel beta-helix repeat-containing protein [Acidobacteriota bacterium]